MLQWRWRAGTLLQASVLGRLSSQYPSPFPLHLLPLQAPPNFGGQGSKRRGGGVAENLLWEHKRVLQDGINRGS